MNAQEFRRVLTAFADHSGDFLLGDDSIVVQVRDELIEAGVRESEGRVFVCENGEEMEAFRWLTSRVAKVPQLADRILANIPEESHFVSPSGALLDQLDTDPSSSIKSSDAQQMMDAQLAKPPFGKSTVIYLTSNAGEGKTTLINHVARAQANRYRNRDRDSNFLLVPISLAGRAFLSFDDIVIAEFVNQLRFPFFYYDAFLELVKMRVLIPAFDGFEEMFAESSTGEAVSALGSLLRDLDSSGAVVIAARRAFFEYRGLETQAHLFDAIGDRNVGFAQIRLERWTREQFVRYAEHRALREPRAIYERVENRLGKGHPFLTRAVLVKRLVDVAEDGGPGDRLDGLLDRLSSEPRDYFYEFVSALVTREANEKWIGASGRPLLSAEEHHGLLAEIALEMWMTATEVLKQESLDLAVELFAEDRKHSPEVARQVVQRVRDHALFVGAAGRAKTYAFDHDDFRHFFLGQAVAAVLGGVDREAELARVLLPGPLPRIAADEAVNALGRQHADLRSVAAGLQVVVSHAPPSSHIRENCGAISMRLLELLEDANPPALVEFGFPADALRGRRLGRAAFEECVFQGTALNGSDLSRCRFDRCTFIRLEIPSDFAARGARLNDCEVACLVSGDDPDGIYDPDRIKTELERAGFVIEHAEAAPLRHRPSVDRDTKLAERGLRCFLRATQVNEDVLRQRFRQQAEHFLKNVVPEMITRGVLKEVLYRGHGKQKRFGLAVPMSRIAKQVPTTAASLTEFLDAIARES